MRNFRLAACLMALPLFADQNTGNQVSLLECKMDSVRDDSIYPCRAGARFASGRPFYCGYGLWVTTDVLYWTALEGGTDYAYSSSSLTLSDEIGTVYKAKFDWDVGYRIGFSYSWPQDNWDLSAYFTRINPTAHNHVNVTGTDRLGSLLAGSSITTATRASTDVDTKLSVLDLEYGRQYFVSRYLFLRPHFGARVGWVHQKMTANYTNATTVHTVSLRNDYDGAGLRLGADTRWFLDRHWSLNLNGSASALYGHFKTSNKSFSTGGATDSIDMSENKFMIAPTAQLLVGLGWETFFSNEGNHLSLNLGYEVNYWWRQNQVVYNETDGGISPYGTRYSDDLGFHGITFDVQISF